VWNFFEMMKSLGLELLDYNKAPNKPGFYLLFTKEGNFIYVGKAHDLKAVVLPHFADREPNERIRGFARYVIWQMTPSLAEAESAEGELFDHYVRETGEIPFANKNAPPRSKLSEDELKLAKLKAIFSKFRLLVQRFSTV
jgi:GIY-YIG catalytic domain